MDKDFILLGFMAFGFIIMIGGCIHISRQRIDKGKRSNVTNLQAVKSRPPFTVDPLTERRLFKLAIARVEAEHLLDVREQVKENHRIDSELKKIGILITSVSNKEIS